MRFTIRHETVYRYSAPVAHSTQLLRLTPRFDPHQRLIEWTLDTPGRRARQVDAFGNIAHLLTVNRSHHDIRVVVGGIVDVGALRDGRLDSVRDAGLSPLVFATPTGRTQPLDAVVALARAALPDGLRRPAEAIDLAGSIVERIAYVPGATDASATAAEAIALGQGVCQDHAHVFLACARALGRPARYVSGYLNAPQEDHASHAWVDVWFDGLGWVSVDVTHAQFAGDRHCRVAVGRDYDSAGPVRGVRSGGGHESMAVSVALADVPVQ